MQKEKRIAKEVDAVQAQLRILLANHAYVEGKLLPNDRFSALSRETFEPFNVIESPHFRVVGKLAAEDGGTLIRYEVKGNATFMIVAFAVALMAIPTFIIGTPHWAITLLLAVLLVLSIVWASRKERQLRQKGEQVFESLLNQL